jgi:hypothetical protein
MPLEPLQGPCQRAVLHRVFLPSLDIGFSNADHQETIVGACIGSQPHQTIVGSQFGSLQCSQLPQHNGATGDDQAGEGNGSSNRTDGVTLLWIAQ